MAKPQMKRSPKGKGKDNGRKFKKKISILNSESIDYVDWKDANLLRRFVSDRAKVRARRVTGNDVQQQREVAKAIKIAREMALIPYAKRVAQTRTSRPPRDGDSRRGRDEDQVKASQVEAVETVAVETDEVAAIVADEVEA